MRLVLSSIQLPIDRANLGHNIRKTFCEAWCEARSVLCAVHCSRKAESKRVDPFYLRQCDRHVSRRHLNLPLDEGQGSANIRQNEAVLGNIKVDGPHTQRDAGDEHDQKNSRGNRCSRDRYTKKSNDHRNKDDNHGEYVCQPTLAAYPSSLNFVNSKLLGKVDKFLHIGQRHCAVAVLHLFLNPST